MLRSTRTPMSPATLALPVAVALVAMATFVAATWPVSAGAQQRRAVVVTDSILLGAQGPLVGRLRGAGWAVDFDGSVSRSTLAGAEAVRSHGLALSDTLVVGLGANDSANAASFRSRVDAVMEAAAAVPHVYWLTIREVRPYYAPANQVLRDAAARYPNLQIIDWNAAAAAAGGSTSSDGLHLSPAGAQRLADLVAGTVTSGPAPAAPAPVGDAVAAPAPAPASESAPASAEPVAPVAEPLQVPTPAIASPPQFDRSVFVSVAPVGAAPLGGAQPTRVAADGADGPGGVGRWLLGVGVLVAGAYLVTSRLAARSPLAASLSGTSGPVRRASQSRAELRAARIAGAKDRHPSTAVVAPVPDEPVGPIERAAPTDPTAPVDPGHPGVLSGSGATPP